MNEQFKRGDQVARIPDHADNIDHPDVEFGFVTGKAVSYPPNYAFVRYWSKQTPNELRTKANSEATPVENLVKYQSKSQEEIDELLKTL
jgi:hypothetical protein